MSIENQNTDYLKGEVYQSLPKVDTKTYDGEGDIEFQYLPQFVKDALKKLGYIDSQGFILQDIGRLIANIRNKLYDLMDLYSPQFTTMDELKAFFESLSELDQKVVEEVILEYHLGTRGLPARLHNQDPQAQRSKLEFDIAARQLIQQYLDRHSEASFEERFDKLLEFLSQTQIENQQLSVLQIIKRLQSTFKYSDNQVNEWLQYALEKIAEARNQTYNEVYNSYINEKAA